MKAKTSQVTLFLLLSAGISFFLFPSCEKIKELTTFKVKYDLPDSHFTIDSTSLLKTEKVLFSQSFTANIDSVLGKYSGALDYVSFNQLRLSIVSPQWVNFDWLTSARVTVTPVGSSPIEVATTSSINKAARSIDFQMQDLDIASKITGPFILTVYGNLNGPVPVSSVDVLLESGIEITISPL